MNDQNNDHIDEIFRTAIAERVHATRNPRPFDVLPDQTQPLRPVTASEVNQHSNQRGILVGALALIAIVAMGGLFAFGRGNGTTLDESAAAEVPAASSGQGELPSASALRPETDDTSPVTTVRVDPANLEPFKVEMICESDFSAFVDVPAEAQDTLDEMINSLDICQTEGGLAGITFQGCPERPIKNSVPVDVNGFVPGNLSFDMCDFITGQHALSSMTGNLPGVTPESNGTATTQNEPTTTNESSAADESTSTTKPASEPTTTQVGVPLSHPKFEPPVRPTTPSIDTPPTRPEPPMPSTTRVGVPLSHPKLPDIHGIFPLNEKPIWALFSCGSGEGGGRSLGITDPIEIDGLIDQMSLCEGKGGLQNVSYITRCNVSRMITNGNERPANTTTSAPYYGCEYHLP